MKKYQFRLFFEHGGGCLWSINFRAKDRFGYLVEIENLPISNELKNEINLLEEEFATFLDWNCPQNPSTWTDEHKLDFYNRATDLIEKIISELGTEFEIVNDVKQCIEIE